MRLNGWQRIGIVASVVWALASPTAQAADTTLTLACEGTKTETSRYGGDAERRKAVSLSIIINFAARTVTGFREEERLVELTIDDISETTISFAGSNSAAMVSYNMNGTIDRVTGTLEAGLTSFPEEGHGLKTWTTSYALKCRPAQRMF
jgi:hypothetical protein